MNSICASVDIQYGRISRFPNKVQKINKKKTKMKFHFMDGGVIYWEYFIMTPGQLAKRMQIWVILHSALSDMAGACWQGWMTEPLTQPSPQNAFLCTICGRCRTRGGSFAAIVWMDCNHSEALLWRVELHVYQGNQQKVNLCLHGSMLITSVPCWRRGSDSEELCFMFLSSDHM